MPPPEILKRENTPLPSCATVDTIPLDERLEACAESMLLCLQARDAARRGRLNAAQGLMQTATFLFDRAACEGADDSTLSPYLEELAGALCFAAQVIEIVGGTQIKHQIKHSRAA